VGRCLRSGNIATANFASLDEYRLRMVEEFGFTESEVKTHTNSARSYLAYPLKNGDAVAGVLYFFSTEPQVFPLAAPIGRLETTSAEVLGLLRTARLPLWES
jgi:hypothetical protein